MGKLFKGDIIHGGILIKEIRDDTYENFLLTRFFAYKVNQATILKLNSG